MNRQVFGLAAIAVMLTLLLFQAGDEVPRQNAERLLPGLADRLDSIDVLDIQVPADDHGIRLERQDGAWVIATADGYPADAELVSRFLISLSEMEIAEMKTARAENHARLGLADNGIVVRLAPLDAALVFGLAGPNDGRFVRFVDVDQTLLTRQPLEIGTELLDWIDPVVMNIPAERVQAVTIRHQDGSLLSAARGSEDGAWQVDGLPANRELRYPTIADSLGRLLVNVRATDIAVYDPARFEAANELSVTMDQGQSLKVYTVAGNDAYWLHTNHDDLGNWQYRISEFTYNELTKTVDDLLAAPEEEE